MPEESRGPAVIEGPDGLQELDNPMPRWMAGVFILTIAWGVGYLVLYPGVGLSVLGWTQKGAYADELAAAPRPASAAAPVGAGDAVRGHKAFDAQCAACHAPGGTGAIGPNLTDAAWLHGGTRAAIAHTIGEGTAKGMPAFKAGLSAGQIADLAAYVHGLGGGK